MTVGGVSRGHPLVALVAVLGGWIGGRVANWEPPLAGTVQAAPATAAAPGADIGYVYDQRTGPQTFAAWPQRSPANLGYSGPGEQGGSPRGLPRGSQGLVAASDRLRANTVLGLLPIERSHLSDGLPWGDTPRFYAPELPGAARTSGSVAAQASPAALPVPRRRWSADAWALLRRDDAGAVPSAGLFPGTYGASQAGAVLRYRLRLQSPYRPTLYMRTTLSMGRMRETAAALGASLRPVPGVPVTAAVEGRLTEQGGRRRFQPAAMAVTELPSFALPGNLRAEAYAQAGYVAGSFSTAFIDGQLRADRSFVQAGPIETRVGGGVWGGAQKGAARLDAGPSASLAMPLGRGMFGRVAVDWRFRVAGDAVPGSGPALTLSAGF